MENEWMKMLAETIIPALGMILVALAGWAVAVINKKVAASTDNENAKTAMRIITDLIRVTVDSLQQGMVNEFKKAAADGKLTEEERIYIKEKAIKTVMNQIPPAVKKSAELAVVSVQDYIADSVEQSVLWNKTGMIKCEGEL